MSHHDGANEARPLLPSSSVLQDTSGKPNTPLPPYHHSRCSWPWQNVVTLVIAVAIVSDMGESLYTAPAIRLIESKICSRYYDQADPSMVNEHGDVPEYLCKVNAVQNELSFVIGWQMFFDSVAAILVPLPYGYLADKRGRKWILIMAMATYTLSYVWTMVSLGVLHLPVRYVWLSSLIFLAGGGQTVGVTMLTTVVADVVPPELRSTVFFYRFCTDLFADLTVPPITAILMSRSLWIPLCGAVLFQSTCVALILTIPETLPLPTPKEIFDDTESASTMKDDLTFEKKCRDWVDRTRSLFGFVTRDATIAALVLTFLISKVGRQSNSIIFQYASKRYGWALSKAGLLLSLRAAVNIALFTLILPTFATLISPLVGGPAPRDLLLAKGSITFLFLGSFVLFWSSTPALMIIGIITLTLGTGFAPTARNLVTSLVESHNTDVTSDIGRLYALISMIEGIGSLIVALGMPSAFRYGLSLGREWLGLPFGFAAVLFALMSCVVFSIKVEHVT